MYETLRRMLVDDLRLNPDAVRPDASCEDAGLDQLALVELRVVLQDRLDLDVNDDELLATTRLADIVRLMDERANPFSSKREGEPLSTPRASLRKERGGPKA